MFSVAGLARQRELSRVRVRSRYVMRFALNGLSRSDQDMPLSCPAETFRRSQGR